MTPNEFSDCTEALFKRINARKPESFGFRITLDTKEVIQFYPNKDSQYWQYFHRHRIDHTDYNNNDVSYVHVCIHDHEQNESNDYFIPASIIKYISVVYPDKNDDKQLNNISW